jgi:hypothetical protein
VPPARPRSTLLPPGTTKDGKPSEEWRSLEQEWIKLGTLDMPCAAALVWIVARDRPSAMGFSDVH